MHPLILLLGCAALGLALRAGLRPRLAEELEQAALLPFADDPEAARQMSAETGRVCARVVTPLAEPVRTAEDGLLVA